MAFWRKTALVGLSSFVFLSTSGVPVFSDAMWVPRLGYTPDEAKVIYLDIRSPKDRDAYDKQTRKEAREKFKALQDKSKAVSKVLSSPTATPSDLKTVDGDTVSDENQQDAQNADTNKPLTQDQRRRIKDLQTYERYKTMRDMMLDNSANLAVNGEFFLFNIKDGRLLEKETPKPRSSQDSAKNKDFLAPYYIQFKQAHGSGLYDLAVRGSGHLSQEAIRISDSIYWDALQPVMQDLSKTHCPQDTGTFRVLQQCYELSATPQKVTTPDPNTDDSESHTRTVDGGWYVDHVAASGPETGFVKSTAQIADITELLLNIYSTNPKSFKYLLLKGTNYAESAYPDILDEANWGLQYLLSVQQGNGGFYSGIKQIQEADNEMNWLTPETQDASARSIMALATAAKAFEHEDLSLSVKFLRMAEKGWQHFQAQYKDADPQLVLLSAGALMQASDNPVYAKAFADAKAQVKTVDAEMALLLGPLSTQVTVQTADFNPDSSSVSTALPLLVSLVQDKTEVIHPLSRWVTNLFGYERVALVRDSKMEMVSPWTDPLQWAATKTGDSMNHFGELLADEGITRKTTQIDAKLQKKLDDKEAQAFKRIDTGYQQLTLTTLDKVHLAYMLTELNQHATHENKPEIAKKQPFQERFPDPVANQRGFYNRGF
jgi:Glycosyl hydrolase family 9